MTEPLVTFTISISRNGDVTNDTQTHGNTFAEVYRGFQLIKTEVERQIAERRNCPFNPKYGKGLNGLADQPHGDYQAHGRGDA